MRRSASLTLFLAALSVVSGSMLSNASWVGKVGMDLFYEEYTFLNTWWKAALLVFAVLIFLYAVQSAVQLYSYPQVARLVNEELQPGIYEYDFDGKSLSSGMYFYRLEAGDFIETRKMILVK